FHERRGRSYGLLAVHGDREAVNQVYATRSAAEHFFEAVLLWRASQARRPGSGRAGAPAGESLRVRPPGTVTDLLSGELAKLESWLDRIAEHVKSDEEQVELSAAANRCHGLADSLQAWLGQKLAGQVYWLDVSGERAQRIVLASAPIDVGPALR